MIEKEFELKEYTIAGKVKISVSKTLIIIKAIDKKSGEVIKMKEYKPLFNDIYDFLFFLSKRHTPEMIEWISGFVKLY